MAKEALPANTFTKVSLRNPSSVGAQFGTATFGVSTFGSATTGFSKVALPVNSYTKETLTTQIT